MKKQDTKESKGAAAPKSKPRGNAKNLVPNSQRTPRELRKITRKGGIASGKARREKRDRMQQAQMILKLAVKDPEIADKLDEMGIPSDDRTIETAMDVSMASKAIKKGDPMAYRVLKEEAYGKVEKHDTLDINAEVKSININIKNYER